MIEVGTTNQTRLADYAAALTDDTAAIMKTHASNYRIVGFAADVELKPLAELARRSGALLIFDAGSGLILPADGPPFTCEPVVRQAVADGADIVTFSTDKLLGGPQGGAIVGRRDLVERISRHPLKRAVRVGKLTLAALEAALRAHLRPDGVPDTVAMRLIHRPVAELEKEARALADAIRGVAPAWETTAEADESSIGGGSLPGETVPTVVLWLHVDGLDANALAQAFREHEPPIFGRFRQSRFGLDLRTLLPGDADDIVACAQRVASEPRVSGSETQ
jgi:L-seryl-tRNA(Ser) seleniumtransferase